MDSSWRVSGEVFGQRGWIRTSEEFVGVVLGHVDVARTSSHHVWMSRDVYNTRSGLTGCLDYLFICASLSHFGLLINTRTSTMYQCAFIYPGRMFEKTRSVFSVPPTQCKRFYSEAITIQVMDLGPPHIIISRKTNSTDSDSACTKVEIIALKITHALTPNSVNTI